MASIMSWEGSRFLDVGCGSGFHLPGWASVAATVIGVEPHQDLAALARRRTRRMRNVSVEVGTAQALPVADSSIDVMQARWAYFFGPGCEPGLLELDRVMARDGTAFVVDNDACRSTFGGWFRRGCPEIDPDVVERFWSVRGWTRIPVDMGWSFERRADLEAVVRIEFAPDLADAILAEHEGTDVDYAVNVWWRRY
ncbi:class I SAM-dependent methyltransferase [Nocardioides sp.]|uniref:class I SAM-dependent methyltransferase n=1 Tax=Nocardioides sp. TaxID=35761 RepID=UPI002BD0CF13|nr:methyltransferase domain-containing protein [Nocardioides sp.]HXH79660.1 methyltransferase domain-containing protein [Nocardioides sp.]